MPSAEPVDAAPAAPSSAAAPSRAGVIALLAAFVITSGFAAPMIKLAEQAGLPACRLAAGRLLLAALALTPLAIARARAAPEVRARDWWRRALLPGAALGAHFVTWNFGVQTSSVADAALIGNLTPVVMPFVLALVVRERLTGRELAATIVAFAGLGARATMTGVAPGAGDLWCLAATAFYALYIALARRHRGLPSVWPYIVCVYAIGGGVCAALSLAIEPWTRPSHAAIGWLLALTALPTLVGHSAVNAAMRRVRGQIVAIVGLLAAPLAALVGWAAMGEPAPDAHYAVAFAAVAISLGIAAWPRRAPPVAP